MLHTTAGHMQDQRALFHPPQPLFFLAMTIYITTHHLFFRFLPYLYYSYFMLCLYLQFFLPLSLPFPPYFLVCNIANLYIVNLHSLKADEVVGADWEQDLLMAVVTRFFLYLGKDVTMELREVTVSKPTALL